MYNPFMVTSCLAAAVIEPWLAEEERLVIERDDLQFDDARPHVAENFVIGVLKSSCSGTNLSLASPSSASRASSALIKL